jgi:hypothetical protein
MSVAQPEDADMGVRKPAGAHEHDAGREGPDTPRHAAPIKSPFEPPCTAERCGRRALVTLAKRKTQQVPGMHIRHHPRRERRVLREVFLNLHGARRIKLGIDVGVKIRLGDGVNHSALRQL